MEYAVLARSLSELISRTVFLRGLKSGDPFEDMEDDDFMSAEEDDLIFIMNQNGDKHALFTGICRVEPGIKQGKVILTTRLGDVAHRSERCHCAGLISAHARAHLRIRLMQPTHSTA